MPSIVESIIKMCDDRYIQHGTIEVHMVDLNKKYKGAE